MRFLIPVFFALISFACTNTIYPFDEVMIETSNLIETRENDDIEIDFWLQNPDDLNRIADPIFVATEAMNEVSPDKRYRHIILYIPDDLDTWRHFLQGDDLYRETRGIHSRSTEVGNFVIALQPESDIDKLVYAYLHELTHEIERLVTGRTSESHSDPNFWGIDGIWKRAFAIYLDSK